MCQEPKSTVDFGLFIFDSYHHGFLTHFAIGWPGRVYDVYTKGRPKRANVNCFDNTVSGVGGVHVFNLIH